MSTRAVLLTTEQYLVKELQEALAALEEANLHYCAPAIDERPVREVAIHAIRPVLAAMAIVAGQEWPPRPALPETVDELQALLTAMDQQIAAWLQATAEEILLQPVALRWGHFDTGADALVNALAHGFVHIGAIRGIRAIGGFPAPPVE